jgi:F0F1-type ATP synthase delta subunit
MDEFYNFLLEKRHEFYPTEKQNRSDKKVNGLTLMMANNLRLNLMYEIIDKYEKTVKRKEKK